MNTKNSKPRPLPSPPKSAALGIEMILSITIDHRFILENKYLQNIFTERAEYPRKTYWDYTEGQSMPTDIIGKNWLKRKVP